MIEPQRTYTFVFSGHVVQNIIQLVQIATTSKGLIDGVVHAAAEIDRLIGEQLRAAHKDDLPPAKPEEGVNPSFDKPKKK